MASPRNMIVEAYHSLSADINKMPGRTSAETSQGVVSAKLPEISVETPNEEVIKTLQKFEKTWQESDAYAEWSKRGAENTNYWKGKHFQRPDTDKTRAIVDNVIFEAVETSLPQYIARNPQPDVELRRAELDAHGQPTNPIATVYVESLQTELGDLGDELKLKAKMKKVARHWALSLLGVGKVGWDATNERPMIKPVRPKKIILDPDATIDEDGYTGELVGEYRKLPAQKMIPFLTEEGAEAVVKDLVKDDMATSIQFIEWWSDKMLIWTMGKTVLMKRQNPHWNYDEEAPQDLDDDFQPVGVAPEGSPAVPQLPTAGIAPSPEAPGRPTMPTLRTAGLSSNAQEGDTRPSATEPAGPSPEDIGEGDFEENTGPHPLPAARPPRKGVNHFPAPRKPYLFVVMLNLGDQPMDNTSFITQNLASQDIINKRNKQIDKNADNMNGGLVVSLERSGLTTTQARGVTEALRKGGVVGIPMGAPQDAVWRPPTPGLPVDVYNNLTDLRQRVRGIFGVNAGSPQDLEPDNTVRGRIMNRTLDTDRIGGGISEILEQFADDFYNWAVQLKLVYEEKYREMAAMGGLPAITVSIKEGSLLPKDKVSLANQASDLAGKGLMSTIDLYKALDYPNAEELAANAWLQVNAPDLLFPDDPRVQAAVQRQQAAAQAEAQAKSAGENKPPSESISFKDLPPDGKAQMAAKVGITLHPEGIAAHDQLSNGGGESPPPDINKDVLPRPQ